MADWHDGTASPLALDDFAARILSITPLPGLSHEEHRAASQVIQDFSTAIQRDGDLQLSFESLCTIISHLRSIGDPSAAETIALHSYECFRSEDRPISAVTMLNAAGLACLDQGALRDAEQWFSRALQLIPTSDPQFQAPWVLLNQAAVLTDTDRFEEALKLYAELMRLVERRPQPVVIEMDSLLPQEVRGLVTTSVGWVMLRSARAAGDDKTLLRRAASALDEALSLPLHSRTRVIALGHRAEVLVRGKETRKAERILAALETECMKTDQRALLPEVYRRWAQVCASRGEIAAAVEWARKAMQSSLRTASPRQELRIVEVILDILHDVIVKSPDPRHALESTGEPVAMQVLELLQSKDTYTGGNHSVRVAGLAGRIAARVLSDGETRKERVRQVELDGLFHDFGKLFLPWCLLNKVSRLSKRDWGLLQAHTTRGEELLNDLGLQNLARVAGGHHERPDGTGYPRQVKRVTKEEAIVAVADAFEAMTSPSRTYARPKTVAEALAEVQRASGSQFHPRVVAGLPEVFERSA